ncbi:MFS general substrate transporter [Trichoderma barbatum]
MDTEKVETVNDVDMIEYQEKGFLAAEPDLTADEKQLEKRLVLKADVLIVGMTSLVFLVNQWDRGNIGNARVMGLQNDLNISNGQFYDAVSLYYVGYVICIIPANLSIRFFKAHRQIGGCVILFATLSCCMAAAKNAAAILALRILFGFVSTFLQALTLYTSLWYKRNELASRSGAFYSAATIAGGFSGLIAYAIQKNLDGALGRAAWQWLFIIQGCAGIFVGICAWLLLPPPPDQIKDLKHWVFSKAELEVAMKRLKTYNKAGAGFDKRQMLAAFKDPKVYFCSFMNAGISLGLASISAFLPSFIQQFNYSPTRTQLFSIIPYACAFTTLLIVNFVSDRTNVKGPFLMLCFGFSITGYIVLMVVTSVKVKIFGTCLITMGVFPCVTLLGAWTSINVGGFTKRAMTWGTAEVVGQCFAILASHIYTDPPRYLKGHAISLSFQILGFFSALSMWIYMRYLNGKKEEEAAHHQAAGTVHPMSHQSLEEVYDYHPDFRYIL